MRCVRERVFFAFFFVFFNSINYILHPTLTKIQIVRLNGTKIPVHSHQLRMYSNQFRFIIQQELQREQTVSVANSFLAILDAQKDIACAASLPFNLFLRIISLVPFNITVILYFDAMHCVVVSLFSITIGGKNAHYRSIFCATLFC